MKALIVVLLISALPFLAVAREDTCLYAKVDQNLDKPHREFLTLEEGEHMKCGISFRWSAFRGCVVKGYEISNGSSPYKAGCGRNGGGLKKSISCRCSDTDCNNFQASYGSLIEFSKWADGSYKDLANCLIMKIKSNDLISTTTMVSATEQSTNLPDTSRATTKTSVATSTSSQSCKDEKSSSFLGLFIGSAVFNVLTVVTILVLVIVIIKMKKGGEAKQGKAKIEQKVTPTETVVQIENSDDIKKSSEVLPSTDNKAEQVEASTDTTTLNTALDPLDTTGSSTISDSSTGQYGFNQVQISVRGFQKN